MTSRRKEEVLFFKGNNVKKLLLYMAIVAGTGMLVSPFALGTPEMAKKENTECVTCHTAVGKKDLNETGKCYKKNNSLKDCPLPRSK
jgi:hypothetical protein